jgi:antitoxin (DNA-binding transcriptional repressor) of toxin-antitoxin stability system
MKKVTMLEFRRDAEGVIRKVQAGTGMVLTYRGKPVMKLEPIKSEEGNEKKKSLLSLLELADKWDSSADSTPLTNEDIDRLVYGY